MNLTKISSLFFIVGCGLFTIDSIFYLLELGINLHQSLYFLGSFTFLIGSVIWYEDS